MKITIEVSRNSHRYITLMGLLRRDHYQFSIEAEKPSKGSEGVSGAAVDSSAVGSQTSARVEMCGSDCCPDDGQCENCQNPIRTGG